LLDQLRRALPAPDVLLKAGDSVALNPRHAWTDTAAFALQRASALRADQLDRLAAATQLYCGPFLDGFALPAAALVADLLAVAPAAARHQPLGAQSAWRTDPDGAAAAASRSRAAAAA